MRDMWADMLKFRSADKDEDTILSRKEFDAMFKKKDDKELANLRQNLRDVTMFPRRSNPSKSY